MVFSCDYKEPWTKLLGQVPTINFFLFFFFSQKYQSLKERALEYMISILIL